MAAKACAKAEAAHVQASFAQREADMIKAQAYTDEEQQMAAAEATRKKAELKASLNTLRLESAAAAAIAEAEVLEAAAEGEYGDPDRASLKSAYTERKYKGNPVPDSHQDSKPPQLISTPRRQHAMDDGELAKCYMGRGAVQPRELIEGGFPESPAQHAHNQE